MIIRVQENAMTVETFTSGETKAVEYLTLDMEVVKVRKGYYIKANGEVLYGIIYQLAKNFDIEII